MGPGAARVGEGYYPEREEAPVPFFDRVLANLGYYWHNSFSRRLEEPVALSLEVARHMTQRAATVPASRLADLRYRLRRDGLQPALVAESFGSYYAALPGDERRSPLPGALGAALTLLKGGIAGVAAANVRYEAMNLAATTWAICGVPVHFMTGSETRARAAAAALQAPLAALGFDTAVIASGMGVRDRAEAYQAAVVCGFQREFAHDYLRDRLVMGGRSRRLAGALSRLSGDGDGKRSPALRGLQCALVDDADAVMLDDAPVPLVLTGDTDQSRERLIYEQALEMARALAPGADFTLDEKGPQLTGGGAQRLGTLLGPLGGIWAAGRERQNLIELALKVLHQLRRDVDYGVQQDRVIMRGGVVGKAEATQADQLTLRLLEVKEGCRMGVRPDVLARVSLPRFFRRYLHLAGVCADPRGLSGEFWSLYGLKVTVVGTLPDDRDCPVRVLATTEARRAAVVERARERISAGHGVLVAVRTPAEAQALATTLGESGLATPVLSGAGDPAEQQVLARLDSPGGLVLALYAAERSVARAGGRVPLTLLVAELHDARRHVQKLRRAYAADECEMLLALEDEAIVSRAGPMAIARAQRAVTADGELPSGAAQRLAATAQRAAERASTMNREDVVARDRQLDDLLAFSGERE